MSSAPDDQPAAASPAVAAARDLPILRPARPADVRAIAELVRPFAERRILVSKDLIAYFEDVQEFTVAELPPAPGAERPTGIEPGRIVGCGALHVMWDDIAEIRTLAVDPRLGGRGVGSALLRSLIIRARSLDLQRLFCLTFEVGFFKRHGFQEISGMPVGTDAFAEIVRSHDDGVAEFLDLARAKPNTLGNTRMLLEL